MMDYVKSKLITDVTTEPLTLAEVKTFLRLDSGTAADNTTVTQSLVPDNHAIAAAYSLVGTSVDILGSTAIVYLNSGTNGSGGTVDVKIQHSDDNSTWTDWYSFTQVTEANDNAVQEKEYTGIKRYLKVVATVAVAACDFGVEIVEYTGATAEDNFLTGLITAARQYCENYTRLALATQTRDYYLDDFPSCDHIEIPYSPLQSVTSVKYKNSSATETTMTVTTQYLVDSDNMPGKVILPYGVSWPSFTPYPYNGVTIRAVVGYSGTTPSIVPKQIIQAMYILIGHWYETRLPAIVSQQIRDTVHALMAPYQMPHL